MKRAFCAAFLLFAMASVASAAWVYPTVVQSYYPVGPVYAYPTTVYPTSVYVEPAPVVYGGVVNPVVPTYEVYGSPYIMTPNYFVPGQPIRNRIRANRIW